MSNTTLTTMSNTVSTLPLLLKQLNLATIQKHWEEESNKAERQNWSYPQYLMSLSEIELSSRYTRRIERHIKESKLPKGKTIEAFDFNITSSINAAQIQALAENTSWVDKAENVIIFGPSGVGKTHIAAAIGYQLITQEKKVLFVSTTALVQKMQQVQKSFKLSNFLNKLSKIDLLILDDIDYVKKDYAETSVLFELIADRYETRSLIITANQAFNEWEHIFPDNMMAVAAIDRLIHHATIINIKEQSYRKLQASNTQKQAKNTSIRSDQNLNI